MMPGNSANHALMTCSISTRPLGEPASGRVKSLTCMGMAKCSLRSIMHTTQRGGWLGWRQGRSHGEFHGPLPFASPVTPLKGPLVARRLLLGAGAGAEVSSAGACVSRARLRPEDGSELPRSAGHVGSMWESCAQLPRPRNLPCRRRHGHAGVVHSPTGWRMAPNAVATRTAADGESVARVG